MSSFKLVILISGNGSTLQSIIDAIKNKTLDATISAVFSDKPEAFGLQRAKEAQIPTHTVSSLNYPDKAAFDKTLQEKIDAYHPNLIVLAGYMRVLTPAFVNHYQNRIVNIHPSLLPQYPGLHTYERALAAHEKFHGSTIHYVTDELDGGPIIAQASFPIEPNDTPTTLKHRTQELEHTLYPQTLQKLAKGSNR